MHVVIVTNDTFKIKLMSNMSHNESIEIVVKQCGLAELHTRASKPVTNKHLENNQIKSD